MDMLEGLNEPQEEAVRSVDGPLLILAGAGSGKTRVLTRRIAYLIGELGVAPGQILAMTFTNKAAGEMRDRVESLLNRSSRGMWIGTFHSLCSRMLRASAEHIGLQSNFAIYDSDDQLTLLRRVIRDQEVSDRQFPPTRIRARISKEKSRMMDPQSFSTQAGTFYEQQLARIYRQYQESLRQNNAVDFDDLLMLTVRLFRENPEVLGNYQERFKYCLIDEYQDTNRPQYLLANMLVEKHRNICVVGDDDQSIYAWRGADLRNILDFEGDYPEAHVVRLEQNYRSTQVILDASNSVIRNNFGRKGKDLWTDRPGGKKIRLNQCADERDEGRWVAGAMHELRHNYKYRDMAILYRTNAQSRAIEEGLRSRTIPYTIVGGLRFYERKEVKDILAYLRVIANPMDSISLGRIVNTPRRGIGDTTVSRLNDFSMQEGLSPFQALGRLEEVNGIAGRTKKTLAAFRELILDLQARNVDTRPDDLAALVVEKTEYLESLAELAPVEAETRTENVKELLTATQEYADRSETPTLEGFLQEVSLVADVDQWSDESDAVTLMTLHSAKGLEFPVVFVTGLEEGLFPILRVQEEGGDEEAALEEERRLFYVGITRAMDLVFLSHAIRRRRYGGPEASSESRFLKEIPEDLIDTGFRISEGSSAGAVQIQIKEQVDRGDSFSMDEGAWVHHPSWGRGRVVNREGAGSDTKLTVRFQDGATKKVVVKYANLQPG
jgi:DNA helicase-2/ATP-dependent DNA helicase PcrA